MARLTITLPDELHRALKEAAARRRRSMGEMVAESLELYGVKTERDVEALVAQARAASGLGADEALDTALTETAADRRRR